MPLLRPLAHLILALSLCIVGPLVRGQTTGSAGSGASIDNRQPSLELNYMICVQGLYATSENPIDRSGEPLLGEIRIFAGAFIPGGWLPCDGRLLSIWENEPLFSLIGTTYGGDGQETFALPDLRGRVPIGTSSSLPLGTQVGAASVTLSANQMPVHSHALVSGSTGFTGGSQPFENRQPALALHHLILVSSVLFEQLGEIVIFAGTQPPQINTRLCQGQLLQINTNQALFSRLGTVYGGDGRTVFKLPDLRERIVIGTGYSQALGTTFDIGQTAGSASTILSTSQMPAHAHSLSSGFGTTGVNGSGAAVDNEQPSMALNFFIYADGTFPSESGTSDPYVADVRITAYSQGASRDSNLMALNGSLLPASQYGLLSYVIQNRYGGVSGTSIGLPNAIGRAIVGAADPASPGQTYGASTYTLTVNQLPAHAHSLPVEAPGATTGSATVAGIAGATLGGTVNARGASTTVFFDYGLTNSYGQSVAATPSSLSESSDASVSALVGGLLPGATYHYRVRAVSAGGTTTGSDATFTTLDRLEAWRLAAFDTTANTDAAADLATPLGDGVPNLMKFAIGVAGNQRAGAPGTVSVAGANLEFVYPRSLTAVAHGMSFTVEWSETLAQESWSATGVGETVLSTNGDVQTVKASVSAGGSGRRFVRLRVTAP